jgi:hypothetical protein
MHIAPLEMPQRRVRKHSTRCQATFELEVCDIGRSSAHCTSTRPRMLRSPYHNEVLTSYAFILWTACAKLYNTEDVAKEVKGK